MQASTVVWVVFMSVMSHILWQERHLIKQTDAQLNDHVHSDK
jgi:hypothetical protein